MRGKSLTEWKFIKSKLKSLNKKSLKLLELKIERDTNENRKAYFGSIKWLYILNKNIKVKNGIITIFKIEIIWKKSLLYIKSYIYKLKNGLK